MITKETFLKEYAKPGSPIVFASPALVYYYYEKKILLSLIEEWLKGTDSYTLHKQPKFPRPRNPTFAYRKRYQFQIDLIDLGNLAEQNDSNRYLLTAIDIFTQFAFVEPLKNKMAKTFMEGFKSIMRRAKQFPSRILANKGAEIKNKLFQAYCKNNNILLLHSNNFVHAPFVERFNRTLKNLMFRYMTHKNTDRYIDALPFLVHTYYNRKHRMIGMSPTEAELPGPTYNIRRKQELVYSKINRKKPKYKIGQTVRISIMKGKFDRGFTPQFKEEIFKSNASSNTGVKNTLSSFTLFISSFILLHYFIQSNNFVKRPALFYHAKK